MNKNIHEISEKFPSFSNLAKIKSRLYLLAPRELDGLHLLRPVLVVAEIVLDGQGLEQLHRCLTPNLTHHLPIRDHQETHPPIRDHQETHPPIGDRQETHPPIRDHQETHQPKRTPGRN